MTNLVTDKNTVVVGIVMAPKEVIIRVTIAIIDLLMTMKGNIKDQDIQILNIEKGPVVMTEGIMTVIKKEMHVIIINVRSMQDCILV